MAEHDIGGEGVRFREQVFRRSRTQLRTPYGLHKKRGDPYKIDDRRWGPDILALVGTQWRVETGVMPLEPVEILIEHARASGHRSAEEALDALRVA